MKRLKVTDTLLQNAVWVCYDCGCKYGDDGKGLSSLNSIPLRKLPVWHIAKCDACGRRQTVTEVHNLGSLRKK